MADDAEGHSTGEDLSWKKTHEWEREHSCIEASSKRGRKHCPSTCLDVSLFCLQFSRFSSSLISCLDLLLIFFVCVCEVLCARQKSWPEAQSAVSSDV